MQPATIDFNIKITTAAHEHDVLSSVLRCVGEAGGQAAGIVNSLEGDVSPVHLRRGEDL
jgi:hypothetical protein